MRLTACGVSHFSFGSGTVFTIGAPPATVVIFNSFFAKLPDRFLRPFPSLLAIEFTEIGLPSSGLYMNDDETLMEISMPPLDRVISAL